MDSTGRPAARIGVAVVAMLVCLIGLGSPGASAAQSGAIYTGTGPDTAPLVDGGLTHSAYFTVTDRSGGSWQSNHSATGAGAHSIVDLDDYAGLTATITVANTPEATL